MSCEKEMASVTSSEPHEWYISRWMRDILQGALLTFLYISKIFFFFLKNQYSWQSTQSTVLTWSRRSERVERVGEAGFVDAADPAGLRGGSLLNRSLHWNGWRLLRTPFGSHGEKGKEGWGRPRWKVLIPCEKMVTGNSFRPGQRTHQKTSGECHTYGQETSGLVRKRMEFEHRHICGDRRVGSENEEISTFGRGDIIGKIRREKYLITCVLLPPPQFLANSLFLKF